MIEIVGLNPYVLRLRTKIVGFNSHVLGFGLQ